MLKYIGVYFAAALLTLWVLLGSSLALLIRERLLQIVESLGK